MRLFCLLVFIQLLAVPDLMAQNAAALDYPRTERVDGYELKVHHPVIDTWIGYELLEGWVPVEVRDIETNAHWVGAVRARARSTLQLDEQLVILDQQEIIDIRFSDPQTPAQVKEVARSGLRTGRQEISLAGVLLALADDFKPPFERADPGFNRNPPRIVISETPLNLLLIDQQPVKAPIQGTSLEVVVNTDWDLFFDTAGQSWYVINQGVWQTQSMLASGAWTSVKELPESFMALAIGEQWRSVRDALPARLPATEPAPLLVSLEATELVLMDGPARMQAIPGTGGLQVVANTSSDLFRLDARWYYLASGRWFSSAALDGKWEPVTELPAAFSKIPPDSGRASVLASVPGTLASAISYIAATLPQSVSLSSDAIPAQQVVYVGPPRFEPVPQTRLERAVNTPFAVLRHNNFYYLNYEAAWYSSSSPAGPWKVALSVPEELFSIPPSDPLHYVTYVKPAASQPSVKEARFTYTEGYHGTYTIGRSAVYGTGWAYSPWVGYPGGGPVYWGYPNTYGAYRAYPYRHPHYYWGSYAPIQQVTIDGKSRQLDGSPSISEQDPRVARPGYDYTTLSQQRQYDAQAAGYAADDLYADPDGQVYRRSGENWDRHDDGEWNTMAELERQYGVASGARTTAPEGQQRQAYRQDPADIERMERYYDRRANSYNAHMNIYIGR